MAQTPRLLKHTLASGRTIPGLGFGTGTHWYKGADANKNAPLDASTVQAVKVALQAGFRHLDNAEMYGTEREMGAAIKEFLAENPGVKREDLFVTTKVYPFLGNVAEAARDSLQRLGLDYVDLYLIHSPFKADTDYKKAWQGLEKLVDEGLVRDIGVSNYRVTDLQELLSYARIKPAVNQIEGHPFLQQPELWQFCKQNGILIEVYSPLLPLTDKSTAPEVAAFRAEVDKIAAAYSKTPAQVLLAWSYQQGLIPVTTSSKPERLQEYLDVWTDKDATGSPGLTLTDDEVAAISAAGAKLKIRRYWPKDFEASGL